MEMMRGKGKRGVWKQQQPWEERGRDPKRDLRGRRKRLRWKNNLGVRGGYAKGFFFFFFFF